MASLNVILEPGMDGKFLYFPGDVIRGAVELTIEQVQKCRGLYMEVFGKAKARWTEGSGKNSSTYEGNEVYLNSRTYLFGQPDGPSREVQRGIHKYNFSFQLPHEIPYTLKVTNGDIYYRLKIVLDIPWGFDKELKVSIIVLSNYNLNLYPHLNAPCVVSKDHKFFSFSETKPLKMIISFPYAAYVVGQDVTFTIKYENDSNIDVTETRVKLKQQITLNAGTNSSTSFFNMSKSKIMKNDVATFMVAGVKAGISKDIFVRFKVPAVMSSNDRFCKIVVVTYYVQVEAQVSGMHQNVKVQIPVAIGNVGFQDQQAVPQEPYNPHMFGAIEPSAPKSEFGPPVPERDYNLPPSFEEAIKMPKVEQSTAMKHY